MNLVPGATSVSALILVVDDDGLPVTGLNAASFPAMYWFRSGAAATAITPLTDLASAIAAFSAGGVFELGLGRYRLDIPNAAISAAGQIDVAGESTGKRAILQQAQASQATVGTNNDKTGYSLSPTALAAIATYVWTETSRTLTSGLNLNLPTIGLDGGVYLSSVQPYAADATPVIADAVVDEWEERHPELLAGGAGPFSLPLKFVDDSDDAEPIGGVSVRLRSTGGNTGTRTTESDGTVEFNVDAGVWKVYATDGLHDFPIEEITVDADTDEVEIEGTLTSPDAPTDPDVCRLWWRLRKNGQPLAGIAIGFAMVNPPPGDDSASLEEQEATATDDDGYAYIDVPQQSEYVLWWPGGRPVNVKIEEGETTKQVKLIGPKPEVQPQ